MGKHFSFLIEYPEPVGYKNLININELSIREKTSIKKESRSEHISESKVIINTIEGIELKKLNTIEIGITDSPELDFLLVTAFPGYGLKTLDFPTEGQNKEDSQASKNFWDKYVFVK